MKRIFEPHNNQAAHNFLWTYPARRRRDASGTDRSPTVLKRH